MANFIVGADTRRSKGVETLFSGGTYDHKNTNSLTYGRGACGVCNRFSELKAAGAVQKRFSNSLITKDQRVHMRRRPLMLRGFDMTEQFISHTLYAVSYSVIGEEHTEFYADFTLASQNFETYQREAAVQDYRQCEPENIVFSRAQVDIPNIMGFIDNNGLLAYVNSPAFSGKVSKTPLNVLYLQSAAE